MLEDHHPPRARRRWFQFGLRTVLIVTALVAAVVAWQRDRLSRWVESLWPAPAAQKDPRGPKQVVSDFLELLRQILRP